MRQVLAALAALILAFALSCSESSETPPGGGGPDTTEPDVDNCPRQAAVEDRIRTVVLSHPYHGPGESSDAYSVWQLDIDGELSSTGERFSMRPASIVPSITFTPDGEIGIAVQDDGTLGIFRVTASGIEVLDEGFDDGGAFYARSVTLDLTGQWLYVVDGSTRGNGGGIYLVHIECDGTPLGLGRLARADVASGIAFVPADGEATRRALVTARDIADASDGHDAHLLEMGAVLDKPDVLVSGDVFADEDASVSSLLLSKNGHFALVGDDSIASSNQVVAIGVSDTLIHPLQAFPTIEGPTAILESPYENAALVTSIDEGSGDSAVYRLGYDPENTTTPYSGPTELTYFGGVPQLPAAAVMVGVGRLRGLVLVAEMLGIRRVQFTEAGALTDLGRTSTGSGYDAMVGTIGVQP
jgi:hypothetical protein